MYEIVGRSVGLVLKFTRFDSIKKCLLAVNSYISIGKMANKRSHVEVSQLEISLILESYVKNSSNCVAIQSDLRRNLHLLQPAARDLYENGKYDKVKRRMSDQVKKATKEGFVPLNDEVNKYIEEIKGDLTQQ